VEDDLAKIPQYKLTTEIESARRAGNVERASALEAEKVRRDAASRAPGLGTGLKILTFIAIFVLTGRIVGMFGLGEIQQIAAGMVAAIFGTAGLSSVVRKSKLNSGS
jgi:hypothetical protein